MSEQTQTSIECETPHGEPVDKAKSASPKGPKPRATFTEGSIFKHVIRMSIAGAVGLIFVFMVDLVDVFFLSLLPEEETAAAVGFAGTVMFFNISFSVGLIIAMGALVGRAIGQGDEAEVGSVMVHTLALCVLIMTLLALVEYPLMGAMLHLIGAEGRAFDLALEYLRISIYSLPFMAMGMNLGAVLRACGDAKWSMLLMISAGAVNAALDPLLIFTAGLGIEGAAIASAVSRVFMAGVGLYLVIHRHHIWARFDWARFMVYVKPALRIAGPAVITNVATPAGMAYGVAVISTFGDSAVAGNTILTRLSPVVFAVFFSLSGAIGPIIAQNLGAGQLGRVREVITQSMKFMAGYSLLLWAVMAIVHGLVSNAFGADAVARSMVATFAYIVVPLTFFQGVLFSTNAAFNNLGRPLMSTFFNITRATLGTVPFVYFGAKYGGPEGAIIWPAVGTALVAVAALWVCLNTIERMRHDHERLPQD